MADFQTQSQFAVKETISETDELRESIVITTMEESIAITPSSSTDVKDSKEEEERKEENEKKRKSEKSEKKVGKFEKLKKMRLDEMEMKKDENQEPSEILPDIGEGVPMVDDPRLPGGWSRKVVQRQTGKSAGKFDVYIYSPDGKKFRSRYELRDFIAKNNLSLDIMQFDFSVRGKTKIGPIPSGPRNPRPKKTPVKKPKENTTQKTRKSDVPKKSTQSKQRLLIKLNFQVPKKQETTTGSGNSATDKPSHSGFTSKRNKKKSKKSSSNGEGKSEYSSESAKEKGKGKAKLSEGD